MVGCGGGIVGCGGVVVGCGGVCVCVWEGGGVVLQRHRSSERWVSSSPLLSSPLLSAAHCSCAEGNWGSLA